MWIVVGIIEKSTKSYIGVANFIKIALLMSEITEDGIWPNFEGSFSNIKKLGHNT